MRSDEDLVSCYQDSGQREALDELTKRHLGSVRATLYTMVLDKTQADDLTQEVFLKAFRGLASFDGRSRFSTWLYRVTMNAAYDFLVRRRGSPVDFRGELPDRCQAASACPESAAMQGELEAAVEAAVQDLPPKLRAAMVLIVLEQLDVGEAARIEGCTKPTMYWRLHEARKRLKRRLKGHLAS